MTLSSRRQWTLGVAVVAVVAITAAVVAVVAVVAVETSVVSGRNQIP